MAERETEAQRQHPGRGAEHSNFLWSERIFPNHMMGRMDTERNPSLSITPALKVYCLKVYKEGDPHWKSTIIMKIISLIFIEHLLYSRHFDKHFKCI